MVKSGKPKVGLEQEASLREKLFFGVVLFCFLLIFSSYFWTPESKKVKALEQERSGIEMQADSLEKLIETTQAQMAKQINEPQQEKKADDRVQKILERKVTDTTKEINTVVEMMSHKKIAKQLQIADITTGKMIDEKNYTVIPIIVEFDGRYAAIEDYLRSLETIEFPMLVKSFNLSVDKTSSRFLHGKIEVNLFIVKR